MRIIQQQKDVWHTLMNPSRHSKGERKRAYLFLLAYCLGAGSVFASLMHFIGAWIASGLLQLVMLVFAMIYALNILDCRDNSLTVLECERAVNPVIEVYVGLRLLQLLHAVFFLNSIVMSLFFMLAFLFSIWRMSRGALFVDATSLWREIGRLEEGSYYHIAFDVVLFVSYLVCMILAVVGRYAP